MASGRSRDRFRQGANEFLALLIHDADINRCVFFTSDQAAQWPSLQSYPRSYIQKILSRLSERRHLLKFKGPRRVRGGYNKGVRNIYAVTPRGRDRALWWRRSHSLLGINYLARGTGDPKELQAAMGLKILSPLFPHGPDSWTFRSREPNSIGFLLTNLSNDITYSFSSPGLDALVWIQRLKDTGLVPRHINPPMFSIIGKVLYQQSDELILVSTLYKSVIHWKRRCETLERETNARSSQDVVRSWQDEVRSLQNEVGHVLSEQRLATERREYNELLEQQKVAYHKLQLVNESQKATLRDTFYYLGHVSDSLNDWTGPMLIPMKIYIRDALMIARLLAACAL